MSRYLTGKQVEENWDAFMSIVWEFPEVRQKKLVAFYDKYATRFATMPASSKDYYHNAFVGGYIDHVLRVYRLANSILDTWKLGGANIDFTLEELRMVTLNHDLGKFGLEEQEHFIDQTDSWKKDRGELYKHNPAMQFMKVSDRTLYLLQHIGVELTQKEWLAISLHDGLYEEAARSYYISYNEDYRLRSNLPYIIHQADLAATRIEYDLSHTDTKVKNISDDKSSAVSKNDGTFSTSTTQPSKSKYSHLLKSK